MSADFFFFPVCKCSKNKWLRCLLKQTISLAWCLELSFLSIGSPISIFKIFSLKKKKNLSLLPLLVFYLETNTFFLFMAAPLAYGNSWARVKSELQLQACITVTAMPYLSCICDLCHNLRQCRILNPLSEARDRTRILRETTSGS